MPARRAALAGLLTCAALAPAALAGCGGDGSQQKGLTPPEMGQRGDQPKASEQLGFPGFATKNTTRVGGADPVADAAAVARAVYPGGSPGTNPPAVVLVDKDHWGAGIAASVLMSRPLRAPVLLTDDGKLPQASADALAALAPTGASDLGGVQVIRVGDVPAPEGYRSTTIEGVDDAGLAAAIDRLQAAAVGGDARVVVVVPSQAPEYAMPAAAWAAKSGDPVLLVDRDTIPGPTFAALQSHHRPSIYVLGPRAAIGDRVEAALRGIGTVTRISAEDPVANAIAFARYRDGAFGWGIVDPGHGLVFANTGRPSDAPAAAPLSASGTYGPLLLVQDAAELPLPLGRFLLDVQPGYERDAVRGVYNHGWLIGDASAISLPVQSRIDSLLEISPVRTSQSP
jgi:hypothetical protein